MLAASAQTMVSLVDSPHALALEEALQTECRLLHNLTAVLGQQRSGVAVDDITAVDDSVFAAQRILLTLSQARQQRKSLLKILVGREEVALADLQNALGPAMTDGISAARDELQVAARALAEELDRNRRILQGAIKSGDQLIRALCGPAPDSATYTAPQNASEQASSALLIDRQV